MTTDLKLAPASLTKTEIAKAATDLVAAAQEQGTELQALLYVNACKQVLEAAEKELRPLAIKEAVKHKDQPLNGVAVAVVNGAGKYDYSHDAEWGRLKEALDKRQELMKAAMKFGDSVVDPDTGELIPAAKYTEGAETVKITFPK